jgi:hypothetical protein
LPDYAIRLATNGTTGVSCEAANLRLYPGFVTGREAGRDSKLSCKAGEPAVVIWQRDYCLRLPPKSKPTRLFVTSRFNLATRHAV